MATWWIITLHSCSPHTRDNFPNEERHDAIVMAPGDFAALLIILEFFYELI